VPSSRRPQPGARPGVVAIRLGLLVLLLSPLDASAAPPPAIVLEGRLLDSKEELSRALGLDGVAQLTKEQGERVIRVLDGLGYQVRLELRGAQTVLRLTPHRVIRKIYMKGNWPLFEEEVLRRLRFRPGQRLPEGQELAQAIVRQEERMRQYLSRDGYFDGSMKIKITPTSVPEQVHMEIELQKGRRYKVGVVTIRRGGREDAIAEQRRAISDEAIGKVFKHHILWYERTFNTAQIRLDVETLLKRFQELGYPGARVKESYRVDPRARDDRAVLITLEIQQRKRIVVEFEGAKRVSERSLRKVLTLSKEGAYDEFEVGQSVKELHRLYQSEGYLQARVRFTRKVGATADTIRFLIEEGPRFRIAQVQFHGNQVVSTDELTKVIKTRPFPVLGYIALGEGGYITDTQLRQDVERLESHYRELGFGAAKVVGEVAPHPELIGRPAALAGAVAARGGDDGKLYVRFTIQEGGQVKVERVEIHGNSRVDTATLLSQLQLKPGRPFTERALSLDKARIARIYGERGHPYAKVPPPLEELSLDRTRASIQFTVVENRPARFGPIFIRGNFKTRRSVILADLPFREGDPFDIRKIEEADARMRNRQIFNVVRLQLIGVAEERAELPVLVTVEERHDDHGVIEVGLGGSTDNLFFGSMAYTNSNLFGFGTSFTFKGEVGMKIQSGTARYRDPRLFGSLVAFDLEGFVRNQLTERLGEVFTVGGTTTVTKELVPNLKALFRYEFRRVSHKEDLYRPAGVDETRQVDVLTQTGGIGPALIYDRRDNPLNPSRGFRVGASMLWASRYLGGHDDFIKLNLSGQAFVPLPKEILIAASVRYDHGFPLRGDVLLPKVERYYAGGDSTIRGIEEDRAWTERVALPTAPLGGIQSYRIRPQGGNIRVLTNLELQFPIWKESLLFGLPLLGAVFFDNGAVTNSFQGFKISDLRQSLGIALRINTPVGFSSFEYAWALDPDVGDDPLGRFHFNFGFVF
jgi:outer membrane protein insertion porin family